MKSQVILIKARTEVSAEITENFQPSDEAIGYVEFVMKLKQFEMLQLGNGTDSPDTSHHDKFLLLWHFKA